MENLVKIYNLDRYETLLNLKRINKLFDGFYEEETDIISPLCLENSQKTIELLEFRYSLLTVINTIRFILKVVLDYYTPDQNLKDEYTEIYSELLSLRSNPENYEKITYPTVCEFVENRYLDYLTGTQNFTKTRNFVMLAIMLFAVPLKLHHLLNIEWNCYEGIDFDDTLENTVNIIKKHGDFFLVINKGSIVNQIIIPLNHYILHRLIGIYTSKFLKNKHHFFSTATGLPITKPNMSNGFINFTRKELGLGLTIYDIRKIWQKTNKNVNEEQLRAFTF